MMVMRVVGAVDGRVCVRACCVRVRVCGVWCLRVPTRWSLEQVARVQPRWHGSGALLVLGGASGVWNFLCVVFFTITSH